MKDILHVKVEPFFATLEMFVFSSLRFLKARLIVMPDCKAVAMKPSWEGKRAAPYRAK